MVRWPEATKYSAGPTEHWVAVVLQATKIFLAQNYLTDQKYLFLCSESWVAVVYDRPLQFPGPKLFKSVVHVVQSDTVLTILTGPPEMEGDHQILGAGGPLGQCSRKLISNPASSMGMCK